MSQKARMVLVFMITASLSPATTGFAQEPDLDLSSAYEHVENQKLILLIAASDDLQRVYVEATFEFRFKGRIVPVFFSFPGVEEEEQFAHIVLDDQVLSHEVIRGGVHPVYDSQVFILPPNLFQDSRNVHRLTVRGPEQENTKSHYSHWGSWHPYLLDRAQPVPIEAEIHTNADYTVVCSGEKVAEAVDGQQVISRWQTNRPQGWLFVSIGKYTQTTRTSGATSFTIYWPQDHEAFRPEDVAQYPLNILDYYTQQFGPSEIKTYRFIEIPEEGLHNFSVNGLVAVTYGSFQRWEENPHYLEAVLVHEIAHYWWGDTVDPQGGAGRWLSEGLAEYSRYLYEQEKEIESLSWSYRNLVMLRQFADQDPPVMWSEQADADSEEAVYYQKGSYVFYMLDQMVGREAFMEILQQFVTTFRGRQTSAEDFIHVAEAVTGTDHRSFFSQWLERPTGPQLGLDAVELIEEEEGFRVQGVITQKPPVYQLRVPVRVVFNEGAGETFNLEVRQARTPFDFVLDRRPESVLLDPEHTLFKWFPKSRLPIDFAEAYVLMEANPRVALAGTASFFNGGMGRPGFVAWLREQFPDVEVVEGDQQNAHQILFGERAAEYRKAHDLGELSSEDPTRLRVFIHRNPEVPETFVLGIEGKVPEAWPNILPQGPYHYIELNDGSYVKVYATALPIIKVRL